MSRSMEERLSDLQKRKQQLIEQEKLIKAKMSQQERKQRTRRLIQEGAVFEKYLGIENAAEAEAVCKYLVEHQGIMTQIAIIKKKGVQDDKNISESDKKAL